MLKGCSLKNYYSYKEQLQDIIPSFIISIAMGIAVYSINLLNITPLLTLIIQMVIGVVVYISMSYLFKLECFYYLISTVNDLLNSKKQVVIKVK